MTTMKKIDDNKKMVANQQQQQFFFRGIKEVDHVLWCKKKIAHE
jgi:hypothetical protein